MDVADALFTAGLTLAGGALAVGGSVYVNRRELTRRTRIEIYTETLPALDDTLRASEERRREANCYNPVAPLTRHTRDLARAGTVAGSADQSRAHAIKRVVDQLLALDPFYDPANPEGVRAGGAPGDLISERVPQMDPLAHELRRRIDEYLAWLEKKIR